MYYGTKGRLGAFESEEGIANYFAGFGLASGEKKCKGSTYTGTLIRQKDKFILLSTAGQVPVIAANAKTGSKMFQLITKSVKICGTHSPAGISAHHVQQLIFAQR